MTDARPVEFTIVIPVKGTPAAKSRMGTGDNSALALAMALDTVEAALQIAPVVVVTADAEPFRALGAQVILDPGVGLNGAIAAALEQVNGPTAVLLGDHPALRPAELADALAIASGYNRALVADADGEGSALTTSLDAHDLRFGADSRARHSAEGYVELAGDWPGLRRDVDTVEQLARLDYLGPRTRALRS
ncbi:MAG: 2-phospho-L-lactate guanylyltransferase [Rhodoglobus sp.]